jgi:hypothetical protein
MDRRIGEVFEWDGKVIMVCKSKPINKPELGCSKCVFNPSMTGEICNNYRKIRGACVGAHRKDGVSVHFVDITPGCATEKPDNLKERPIGDIFEWDGKMIEVCKGKYTHSVKCGACVFDNLKTWEPCSRYKKLRGLCWASERQDATQVSFKCVGQWEERMKKYYIIDIHPTLEDGEFGVTVEQVDVKEETKIEDTQPIAKIGYWFCPEHIVQKQGLNNCVEQLKQEMIKQRVETVQGICNDINALQTVKLSN